MAPHSRDVDGFSNEKSSFATSSGGTEHRSFPLIKRTTKSGGEEKFSIRCGSDLIPLMRASAFATKLNLKGQPGHQNHSLPSKESPTNTTRLVITYNIHPRTIHKGFRTTLVGKGNLLTQTKTIIIYSKSAQVRHPF